MTKTHAAFTLTTDRMFASGPVFFWTFTFYTVHSDTESSRLFSRFLQHLRRVSDGCWGGVRVAELHKEHGVHFHALVNRRLPVDVVRRVAKCYAIGRIFVCKATPETGGYLAKYLRKSHEGPMHESGRVMRRWSAFGDIERTRVSDLQNDSPMWVFRREHHLVFTNWRSEALLQAAWDMGLEEFKSAWLAARTGRMADLLEIVHGRQRVGVCSGREPGIRSETMGQTLGKFDGGRGVHHRRPQDPF